MHLVATTLVSSSTHEILFNAEDTQMWLVDSGATFFMTPHHSVRIVPTQYVWTMYKSTEYTESKTHPDGYLTEA